MGNKIKNKINNKIKNKVGNSEVKEEKRIFKEIENILFSYKKYKRLNRDDEYSDLLTKIEVALEMIDDYKYFDFIKMRYFKKMSYEEIANKLLMDIRSVYYIRIALLQRLKFHFKIQKLI